MSNERHAGDDEVCYRSITSVVLGAAPELTYPVMVSDGLGGEPRSYIAVWDTGSTDTVVTRRVAEELSLEDLGEEEFTCVAGVGRFQTHIASLEFKGGMRIDSITVGEFVSCGHGYDVIIGMDVIGMGEFAVSSLNGLTTFSFRLPAKEHADFTKKFDEEEYLERLLKAAEASSLGDVESAGSVVPSL